MTIELNVLQTTGLAMLLFVLGRFIVNHVGFLRRCCIPAPVVGGADLRHFPPGGPSDGTAHPDL